SGQIWCRTAPTECRRWLWSCCDQRSHERREPTSGGPRALLRRAGQSYRQERGEPGVWWAPRALAPVPGLPSASRDVTYVIAIHDSWLVAAEHDEALLAAIAEAGEPWLLTCFPSISALPWRDAALPVSVKLSAQNSAQGGVTEGALLSK